MESVSDTSSQIGAESLSQIRHVHSHPSMASEPPDLVRSLGALPQTELSQSLNDSSVVNQGNYIVLSAAY